MEPVAAMLSALFPINRGDFDAFVFENSETFLIDMLDLPTRRERATQNEPTAQVFQKYIRPLFIEAAQLATNGGEPIIARRLRNGTLSWLSDAFETHLSHHGNYGNACWRVLGAYKLCPATLRRYLPDRVRVETALLESDMDEITLALSNRAKNPLDAEKVTGVPLTRGFS